MSEPDIYPSSAEVASRVPAATLPIEYYSALLAEVTARGLFKRTYWHYGLTGGIAIIGMTASLYALSLSDNALFQALNAIGFGFFSVQIGMIGHDLSHGEVFESHEVNRFFAMMAWGLLGGLCESRWFHKHNTHHKNPNHIGHDPDLEIPFVFSDIQAARWSDFYKKWFFPYQHILFWIAFSFVVPYNIGYSMQYIFRNFTARSMFELFLMIVHYSVVVGLPLYLLPLPVAILFLGISFIVIGAYIGMVFAPNHKGEEMLDEDEKLNWTHQITLTRDLYPTWPVFYLLGGLNFQIEHHLFPTMSRMKYWEAYKTVKDFCARHELRYHQTTWPESMREIHESLKQEARTWSSAS
jgi:fatty acid desaturase